jgi:hypothetical protein
MELIKVSFKRQSFDIIPEAERIFFIQLSLFADEITILHKLILFSNNHKDDQPVLTAQNIQSFFLVKLLAGKLFEGWLILQKNYFNKLSKKYDAQLSDKCSESIVYIKSYFAKQNLISLIRNKYAFHYDYQRIKNELNSIPTDEVLDLYVSANHGNSLYSMAHIISSYALFNEVDNTDDLKALDTIFKDVLDVSNEFLTFAGELLVKILAAYQIPTSVDKIHLSDVPNIDSVNLPYFIKR